MIQKIKKYFNDYYFKDIEKDEKIMKEIEEVIKENEMIQTYFLVTIFGQKGTGKNNFKKKIKSSDIIIVKGKKYSYKFHYLINELKFNTW
jgi:hypothetical protein